MTKEPLAINSVDDANKAITYVKTDIERLQNAETHIASRKKQLAMLEHHLVRLQLYQVIGALNEDDTQDT